MKKFADSKANQSKSDANIRKIINGSKKDLLAFWYALNERYEDYTRSNDSQLPDSELTNMVNQQALKNGVSIKSPANNDELIMYAAYVAAAAVAIRLIIHVSAKLESESKLVIDKVSSMYNAKADVSGSAINKLVNGKIEGVDWSDRIWANQDALKNDINRIMKQSLLAHTNPVSQTKLLRDRYNVTEMQARRLLRTESARVMAQQGIDNAKDLGYTKVMWVTNTAACRICMPHDGKTYTLNEADGKIPVHPNCLCSWVAVD